MNMDLLERRAKMLKMRGKGYDLKDTVAILARELNIAPQTLYRDWGRRKTWLRKILAIDDRELLFLDLLSIHQGILEMARAELLAAGENGNLKIGCLKLMRALNMDLIQLMLVDNIMSQKTEELSKTAPESDMTMMSWRLDPGYQAVMENIKKNMESGR